MERISWIFSSLHSAKGGGGVPSVKTSCLSVCEMSLEVNLELCVVLRWDQIWTFWPHTPSGRGEIYGLHTEKCTWYTLYDMVVDQWCFRAGLCLEVQGPWKIKDIINSVEKLWCGWIQVGIQMCKPNNIKKISMLCVEDPRSWHYVKRLM